MQVCKGLVWYADLSCCFAVSLFLAIRLPQETILLPIKSHLSWLRDSSYGLICMKNFQNVGEGKNICLILAYIDEVMNWFVIRSNSVLPY